MKKLQLYPHNQTAYEKVMKAFEISNRTCICHPTGTGKSFIVAAVCQHFNNVLILAPNLFVLDQQKKAIGRRQGVFYMTYPGLLLHVSDITEKYDLIVLDEFHRAGAKEWGTAVSLFLEAQSQAKILGTSATPIRYLDNEKDMSRELFKGNIASEMSIAEAWSLNILPIPTYITGFFNFSKVIQAAVDQINASKRIDKEEKRDRVFRLNNKRLDWEKSSGMVSILQKHLNKNNGRILVFCAHIDELIQMQITVREWFEEAGFKVFRTYMIHSNQTDRQQIKEMRRFSNDTSSGIKLMFTVNILNEGVHVPDVDAVIMLRTTSSHIIYLQQLGRCLTAANTKQPIVLDMVDNITTTTFISQLQEEFRRLEKARTVFEYTPPREFEIIDYTLDTRSLINKLLTPFSWEDRIDAVVNFYNDNHRLPSLSNKASTEEQAVARLWHFVKRHQTENPIVQKYCQIEKEQKDKKITDALKEIYSFAKNHKAIPKQYATDLNESTLGKKWKILRRDYPNHPLVVEILTKYSINAAINKKIEIICNKTLKHCKQHGYLPRARVDGKLGKDWYNICKQYSDDSRIKNIIRAYPKYEYYESIDKESIALIKEYYQQHHSFPSAKTRLGHKWIALKRNKRKNPEVQELIDLYNNSKQKINQIEGTQTLTFFRKILSFFTRT